jgi:hypothetical protein
MLNQIMENYRLPMAESRTELQGGEGNIPGANFPKA